MMNSKPILFSAPMVRAILDGSKTQTRRILTPQPVQHRWEHPSSNPPFHDGLAFVGKTVCAPGYLAVGIDRAMETPGFLRRIHQPGDELWVREEHYTFGHWEPVEGKRTKGGRQKWAFITHPDSTVTFTPPAIFRKGRHHQDPATPAWHKRLARFMPRKYSRITLDITDVRIQRLQDISEEDAIAEGVDPANGALGTDDIVLNSFPFLMPWPVRRYAMLWNSINGTPEKHWGTNPFVAAYTFTRATT